jgi:DNA-binding transcriptional regulator LsrR (DeoR family)
MHAAARLYYLEEATQAEIAARLSVSRPTVSRLLAEARRDGIVRIEIVPPLDEEAEALARRVEAALGLRKVRLAPGARGTPGEMLAPPLSEALREAELARGDALLVSSGRTIWEATGTNLPSLPGVVLAPTVGGQDEPEAWYATNEITRRMAERVGGTPTFLYAPALPSAELHATLLADPATRRVTELWKRARCVVLGVGAPLATRTTLPRFVPRRAGSLRGAVGDICSRFYDREGQPVEFPGSERLMATPLERLPKIPVSIALATGAEKVPAILAGAAARYFNELVTDQATATALVAAAEELDPGDEEPRGAATA